MVKLNDLKDPTLLSGYKYVAFHRNKTAKKQFAGQVPPSLSTTGRQFQIVPTRSSASEAALDVVRYLNSAGLSLPQPKPKLRSAGHKRKGPQGRRDPEVEAALGVLRDAKAQRQGAQGYVYLIIEDLPGGGIHYGKIGYSTNPAKRVAELQTGNPRPLRLLYQMPGTEDDEARLHQKYIKDNVLQEWFSVTKQLILEFPAKGSVK